MSSGNKSGMFSLGGTSGFSFLLLSLWGMTKKRERERERERERGEGRGERGGEERRICLKLVYYNSGLRYSGQVLCLPPGGGSEIHLLTAGGQCLDLDSL
jgi:hypothetical protein